MSGERPAVAWWMLAAAAGLTAGCGEAPRGEPAAGERAEARPAVRTEEKMETEEMETEKKKSEREETMSAERTDLARVERWGIFEVSLEGPRGGNPFLDVELAARFTQGERSGGEARAAEPEGFYDGEGVYRVRFMPDSPGVWEYVTKSNRPQLDGKTGEFVCVAPSANNRGPVRVHKTWHLAYADGTPYFQVGTTCYCWTHQGEKLEARTLETLSKAPFNKIRMCVFPKAYAYNKNEPELYPFEGTPPRDWDFTRPNAACFRHFEKRVGELRDLGIEADLILFHPYDRWGFKSMDREADDRYLAYTVARLAAYRNVWWSMANEFDLMFKIPGKKMSDWDRFFRIVRDKDPYGRMRGVHNCRTWYDHTRPWVTHASVQSSNFNVARELREKYRKPVIYDECKYEGNIPQGWGKISAREMAHRFWLGTIQGCYVGHGETYRHPADILWWSKGGVLHGESPARIAFLRRIMEGTPFTEMTPAGIAPGVHLLSKPGNAYLVYFERPERATVRLEGAGRYKVDGIDTWQMTVTPMGSASPGEYGFMPPRAPYLLRISSYAPGERVRPEAKASAEPAEGTAPLTVRFSTPSELRCLWEFGDGARSSETNPSHTYGTPGLYAARLTVTDGEGITASAEVPIAVEGATGVPLVRVGFAEGERPRAALHGKIARGDDGSLDLGEGPPWKWVTVGEGPVDALEGLRSFTILGWAKPTSLKTGRGGNRIAFNLNYDRSGFDLVHLDDGRLRLSVNEWPDRVRNDSSPGKLRAGEWTFFAVTYDSTRNEENVRWYFGGDDAPAALDRRTTYARGPTGTGSGDVTIGNYNTTLHRHGVDRQFRGRLRGIEIFGSRIGPRGALSLEAVRKRQRGD